MITFSRLQHTLAQTIVIGLIGLNFYLWQYPLLGLILAMIYLGVNSKKLADIFFARMHKGLRKTLGLLLILAYIALLYTLAYHFYEINDYVFWFLLISIPLLVELLSRQTHTTHYFLQNMRWPGLGDLRRSLWPGLFLLADTLLIIIFLRQASSAVLRSPWELMPDKFWGLFIFSNLCLAATFVSKKSAKNLWLIIYHFFVLAIIAVIVYPLGYGYDSFIHLAALRTIQETGTIEPRLWLYLGQYGLTFFIQNISQISLSLANKLLLPTLFALFWPSGLFYGLKYGFNWPFKNSYLAVLWSLFVGFSFAIMTTPQGLAFLLLAFYIFILPLVNQKTLTIYILWIIALLTMVIHPLAGLPLLFFSLATAVARLTRYLHLKKLLLYLTFSLAALCLPLFFYLYETIQRVPLAKIFSFQFWPLFSIPALWWRQTYNFPLDLVHDIGQNQI